MRSVDKFPDMKLHYRSKSVGAFVEDFVISVEYSDGEFVEAQVLPDVFHGVELQCIGRQL